MPRTPTAPYALGRGEGELVWWSGHAMLFKSHGDQTGGTLGLIETELHAGFEPPTHHHVRDDEFYYVLEGEMTFRAGDVDFELKDGGYIFLPRKVAHGFMVRGSGVARVLMCTAPAGPRDSGALFYDHGLRGEGTDPPQGVKPIDPETMTGLLSQYDDRVAQPVRHRDRGRSAAGASRPCERGGARRASAALTAIQQRAV